MAAGDAAAAANLFANVRLPASILAGALVPLGFGFALPAEGPALAPGTQRAVIRTHRLVAVTSYSCLLVAIVYASVTINGLAESAHQPSAGAMDLIRHEYELAWIGTNVSFLLGLFGALALVTLRVLLTFERDEGRVAAAVSLSTARFILAQTLALTLTLILTLTLTLTLTLNLALALMLARRYLWRASSTSRPSVAALTLTLTPTLTLTLFLTRTRTRTLTLALTLAPTLNPRSGEAALPTTFSAWSGCTCSSPPTRRSRRDLPCSASRSSSR